MDPFVRTLPKGTEHDAIISDALNAATHPFDGIEQMRRMITELLGAELNAESSFAGSVEFNFNTLQGFVDRAKEFGVELDDAVRATLRLVDLAEKHFGARDAETWPTREIGRARKAVEAAREQAIDHLKQVRHFQRHAAWLIERFPEARYCDVQGLCRAVMQAEIEAADWSLTPGRYVGVAAIAEDEEFDFVRAMTDIHDEVAALDEQAAVLAARIRSAASALFA
jgi:type I restriction enzyme M protein